MKVKVDIGVEGGGTTVDLELPRKQLNLQAAWEFVQLAEKKLEVMYKDYPYHEAYVVELRDENGKKFYDARNKFHGYFRHDGSRIF